MKALIHSANAGLRRLPWGQILGLVVLCCEPAAGSAAAPSYHELRIYTVTSNKLDGVLERFRDTVEPVRRKHGLSTVGYWSAAGTTSPKTSALRSRKSCI